MPCRRPRSPATARPATIAVPGSWTMQDTGDHPHYTNVQMPFPGPPPALPERVTTGVYRTTFTAPRVVEGHADRVARRRRRERARGVRQRWVRRVRNRQPAAERVRRVAVVVVGQAQRHRDRGDPVQRAAATSRIRTSGGWPGCTAPSTSSRGRPCTSPTCAATATTTRRPGTGSVEGRHRGRVRHRRRSPDGPCAPRCATRRVARSARRRSAPVPHAFAVPYVFTGHTVERASGRCRRARRGRPRSRTSTRSRAS